MKFKNPVKKKNFKWIVLGFIIFFILISYTGLDKKEASHEVCAQIQSTFDYSQMHTDSNVLPDGSCASWHGHCSIEGYRPALAVNKAEKLGYIDDCLKAGCSFYFEGTYTANIKCTYGLGLYTETGNSIYITAAWPAGSANKILFDTYSSYYPTSLCPGPNLKPYWDKVGINTYYCEDKDSLRDSLRDSDHDLGDCPPINKAEQMIADMWPFESKGTCEKTKYYYVLGGGFMIAMMLFSAI
jgi:hypothetical protein